MSNVMSYIQWMMKFAATLITIGGGGGEFRYRKIGSNPDQEAEEEALDLPSLYNYMLGRFAWLSSISHENLCKYFELTRCQTVPYGFVLISEHHSQPYTQHDCFLNSRIGTPDLSSIFSVACQLCSAVEHCHKQHLAIGTLSLDNLLVVEERRADDEPIRVKLSQWGLGYVAGDFFPDLRPATISLTSLAPELLMTNASSVSLPLLFCADIWALGVLLIELFTGWRVGEMLDGKGFLAKLGALLGKKKSSGGSICAELLDVLGTCCPAFAKKRPSLEPILSLVDWCLQVFPSARPTARELGQALRQAAQPFVVGMAAAAENGSKNGNDGINLDEDINAMRARIKAESELQRFDFNEHNTFNELFFLWKLCGSGVETILARRGAINTRAPVCTLPSLLVDGFQPYGNEETRTQRSPVRTFELPMSNLMERLRSIPRDKLFLDLELGKHLEEQKLAAASTTENGIENGGAEEGKTSNKAVHNNTQSLIVKERDIEYQFRRMRLFRRLLWPNKADQLRAECRTDIPPIYRGPVWAALLGVAPFGEDQRALAFYSLDTLAEHVSDRQLQVDIPRCHQYDDLMSSQMAHCRMKMLLKALLVSRKEEFVYWQGLDSLTAPFLILFFNDLPTAFRCLTSFIDRYLHGFFHKDNSTIIRNYLARFMHVIGFSDPELFAHLISLDFLPELFAIPWFLTCFAHVLPLHKLFHLWDALLLADAEFPLFIGVAILLQLRPRLISANFNEAILLFSDLPDLPIDDVVSTAKHFYGKWRDDGN